MMIESEQTTLAAIDLGSNSFHMIIARLHDGHFQIIDRLREMIQLRAGLNKHNLLTKEAQIRATMCLRRFGDRIKKLPSENVRVVGTNTLRLAKNSQSFLRKARIALGLPIEIIAGEEEARLIYLGVAHGLAFDDSKRLVMDIGGGSTEFIIGERFTSLYRESLEMGCVSFSQQFFADGNLNESHINTAILAAESRLRSIQRPYKKIGWYEVVGTSGTVRCIANIAKENRWSNEGMITLSALKKVTGAMIAAGHTDKLKLAGLGSDRRPMLPAGVAILQAAFTRLNIKQMVVSDCALREGLLYDLLGRLRHEDERDRTVLSMAKRYHVDDVHATRVTTMSARLFNQVAKTWQLDTERDLSCLCWAAKLHEVGLIISHNEFHKHSAYLINHADLLGFSRQEQQVLATIVRGQRRKFPKKHIKNLPDELQAKVQKLTIILRLVMVFNRGRSEKTDTLVTLVPAEKGATLILPKGWLKDHPLTKADLMQETNYLKVITFKLKIQDTDNLDIYSIND